MNKNKFYLSHKAIMNTQAGFSLIEILVGLTLIGIAGTFVVSNIYSTLSEGQIKSTKIQMNGLASRLEDFRRKCHRYPTSDQGLEALVTKPSGGKECKDYPPGGFINGEIPEDPWGEAYYFESDGKSFNIWSTGRDTEEGGEGYDADIYQKKKK